MVGDGAKERIHRRKRETEKSRTEWTRGLRGELRERQGIPLGARRAQCAGAKLISSLLLSSRDPECCQYQRRTWTPQGFGPSPSPPSALQPTHPRSTHEYQPPFHSPTYTSFSLTQPLIRSLLIPCTAPINDGKLFQKILDTLNVQWSLKNTILVYFKSRSSNFSKQK